MADERMGLLELLRKAGSDGDVDFLREGVRALATIRPGVRGPGVE